MNEIKTTDRQLDYIYNYINYLLCRGQFTAVDALLTGLTLNIEWLFSGFSKKPTNLTIDEILAYLTATLPAKSKLNNRRFFVSVAKEILDKQDPELIKGLE
jgi:hypothetical protein